MSTRTVIRGNNDDRPDSGDSPVGPPSPTSFQNDSATSAFPPAGTTANKDLGLPSVSRFLPETAKDATQASRGITGDVSDQFSRDTSNFPTSDSFTNDEPIGKAGQAPPAEFSAIRSNDPLPAVESVPESARASGRGSALPGVAAAASVYGSGAGATISGINAQAPSDNGVISSRTGQFGGGPFRTGPVAGPSQAAIDGQITNRQLTNGSGPPSVSADSRLNNETNGVANVVDPVQARQEFGATGVLPPNSNKTSGGFARDSIAPASNPPRVKNVGISMSPAVAAGADVPGRRDLEGAQTPSVLVEKIAPDEIQIGIEATFEIRVRNVGTADAHNVLVTDQIPRGTKFIDASADYRLLQDGSIRWQLETLKIGAEILLSIRVMPEEEGEIGSVAQISFLAEASVRTVCTRPLLQVRHTAPQKVLIGENVAFSITISNPGTGAATNVILEEDVPYGLVHDAGEQLEYNIGTLRPGESKELVLTLRADKASLVHNVIRVHGNGNLAVTDELDLEVIAPQLQVGIKGPGLRYLNRKATYVVSVSNPGTATAQNVDLVTYLPKGLKFLSTEHEGHYDEQRHAVMWSLEQLSARQVGDVQLVLLPTETGEQKIRMEGRADLNLSHVFEKTVVVDSRPELQFSITDSADPIEVGSETMYEIRISNGGAKTATNVRLAAVLPQGMKLEKADGPTRGTINGQQVLFEPLTRLDPGANVSYQIRVTGVEAGDHRIQVQISNDDNQVPIAHEESTRVYLDN